MIIQIKWAAKRLRGYLRLKHNSCPMCNSDAPELDTCPICEGYHSAKGDNYPLSVQTKKEWGELYRGAIDAKKDIDTFVHNSRKLSRPKNVGKYL